MKKNFLLLFLMALLPLAGWAQGRLLVNSDVEVPSVLYGATLPEPVVKDGTTTLTKGTQYSWDGKYYSDAACETEVTAKNVGTYYVKVVGIAPYSGTVINSFEIQKATLTVTYDAGAAITKIYGKTGYPEIDKTKIAITGWQYSAENTAANQNLIKNSLTYAYTNASQVENANWSNPSPSTGSYTTAGGTGYALTWTATTTADVFKNYKVTLPANVMKIIPIDFNGALAAKFSFATDEKEYDYNGEAQVPVYTIKYKNSQNVDETLQITAGGILKDFSVSYTWLAPTGNPATGTFAVNANDAIGNSWAGFYKATITGNGNYYGTIDFPAKFKDNKAYYKINKVALQINAVDKQKVYDGNAFTSTDVDYKGQGLVPADAATYATAASMYTNPADPAFTYTVSPAFGKNTGVYIATPAVTVAKMTAALQNNYTITEGNNGYMTINKRPVVVTAVAQTRTVAQTDPDLASKVLATTDYATYTNYVTIEATGTDKGLAADNDAEKQDVLKAVSLALNYEYTTPKTYEDAVVVNVDNTKSTNYTVTGVNADFTVNGLDVSISAKNQTVVYGKTLEELKSGLEYTTSGLVGTLDGTIKYTITKMDGTALAAANFTNGHLNKGTYKIVLDKEGSEYTLPAGNTGATFDPTSAVLTISPKNIYAIPQDATLGVNSTLEDLNTIGHDKVIFNADGDPDNEESALAEGDVISYKLVFGTGVTTTGTVGAKAQKITAIATGAKIGVALVAAAGDYFVAGNANANYNIDVLTTANLTDGAGVLQLDRKDADLLSKLTAADGKTYNVTFKNERTLKAQKWYSMVLPFDISVGQLSRELGYAIVNRLNTTTSDGNVHFSLAWGTIPANEPFLVKVQGTETAGGFTDVDLNNITFTGVEITDPEAATVTLSHDGINFIGVYEQKHALEAGDKFYAGTAADKPYEVGTAATTLSPFASYWNAPAGARVFVEDIDENGVTAITEVSTSAIGAIAADGWYTLGGVKLQGAPTEKGVYIKDGKKFVIK